MATSTRVYIDCGEVPSDKGCTLKISGTEDEVLTVAVQHAITSHGHADDPQLRSMLRSALRPEEATAESRR